MLFPIKEESFIMHEENIESDDCEEYFKIDTK
jgi:hypothetical protein